MTFACGMRHPTHFSMSFHTDTHRIEVPRTFFSDTKAQMLFEAFDGAWPPHAKTYSFQPVDQYMLLCEHFAQSVADGTQFIGSLEQTLANTKVLSTLFKAAESRMFERV